MMKKVVKIVVMVLFAILAAIAFGFVVMYLWNWLMPEIFGLPTITFIQAIGLLLLSKILFSGFGGGKCSGHKEKKHKMKERMAGMSVEEREKFKRKLQHKWADLCKDRQVKDEDEE